MDVYEITGFKTGVDRSGVNFLSPIDAFENIENGYIYRQELQSRFGFSRFGNRLDQAAPSADGTRVMGIFENIVPGQTVSQLLVITRKYLYAYNAGVFTRVPFDSSVAIGNFNITSNHEYVSGTTYLTKDGESRFVFTGKGMDAVYFYNGTKVKIFNNNNALDNPDYVRPSIALGEFKKATKVIWFGERLNFFEPELDSGTYHQGVLYSGIRNKDGNGDNFNISGAGLLEADTYESMKGASILGNLIIMPFERSTWTLEKTRDVFNPYLVRKIPSILGTDASFSSVTWNNSLISSGRTGMLITDGRQSLKIDEKLRDFTAKEIDPKNFELCYSGFERETGQYFMSYKSLDSDPDDKTQDKVLVCNYEESTWAINYQRFSVYGQGFDGIDVIMGDIKMSATGENPSWDRMDTTTDIWGEIGIGKSTQKTLAGDDDGFVYQLNTDLGDYFSTITRITQADPCVLSIPENSFKAGDKIVIQNVEGMVELNNKDYDSYTIESATTTTVTLSVDSTDFTAHTDDTGSIAKVLEFSASLVPFNPYRSEGRKCYISHIDFLLESNSTPVTVDLNMDEEYHYIKTVLLDPDTESTKKRKWINISINQEMNFLTLRMKSESTDNRTIITSIRIYAKRGSLDNN